MKLLPYEIWRDIPGFEGEYQVSTMGNVRTIEHLVPWRGRLYHVKSKLIKKQIGTKGYIIVRVHKNGVGKTLKVHKLIKNTFHGPNPKDKPEINHIDENKDNNSISNLEFCDSDYNNNYGTRNERIKETLRKQLKPINQYDINHNFIKRWESSIDIQETLGIKSHLITRCCRGVGKTVHGFVWKYVDD